MQNTTNYGLNKPEATEFYNIEVQNDNMDIIDGKMKEIENVSSEANEGIAEHIANKDNPHEVTKDDVGLGNVPNVGTNNQTPTYTVPTDMAELSSGEKLSAAFGKIAKAVSSLISHLASTSNPHSVTKSQLSLGNVENKSSATIRGELTSSNVTTALGYTPIKSASLNVATTSFAAVTIGKNQTKALGSVELDAGTYLIQGSAVFAQGSEFTAGNVRLTVAQSSGSAGFTNGITKVGYVGVNGAYVEQVHSILYLSAKTTIYLNAYQNYSSSGTAEVTGQLKVLKVKTT